MREGTPNIPNPMDGPESRKEKGKSQDSHDFVILGGNLMVILAFPSLFSRFGCQQLWKSKKKGK